MSNLCQRLRSVDIDAILPLVSATHFVDTSGTNGWIARPQWLDDFVRSLQLGYVTRSLLRLLPAGQGIPAHVDPTSFGKPERRFHIPLVTHPDVLMVWPEEHYSEHLEAGYLYEVDYTKLHEVVHHAPVARIHLQINVRQQ